MSKSQKGQALAVNATKDMYTLVKEGNAYVAIFAKKFVQTAVSAATDLDRVIADKTPVAINLWTAYKHLVAPSGVSMVGVPKEGRASLSALQFFHALDSNIPVKTPKVSPAGHKCTDDCTPASCRKQFNGLAILNRFQYLTLRIGRTAAGDNPKPMSKDERETRLKAKQTAFVKWARKYKLEPLAVKDCLMGILRMTRKTETGETKLSKVGNVWFKAAFPKPANEDTDESDE